MMKKTFIIILIVILCIISVFIFLRKKKSRKPVSVVFRESKEELSEKANTESSNGKGSVGNWGENQQKLVRYTIASSLLEMQTKLTHENMDIYEFMDDITDCLICITKNFSTKYDFSYIIQHVDNEGMSKDFDTWFKNLYTTCDCEDKLGQLLVKLLKDFWIQKSINGCSKYQNQISKCISAISITDFSQGMIDYLYKTLEDCVGQYCPQILNK